MFLIKSRTNVQGCSRSIIKVWTSGLWWHLGSYVIFWFMPSCWVFSWFLNDPEEKNWTVWQRNYKTSSPGKDGWLYNERFDIECVLLEETVWAAQLWTVPLEWICCSRQVKLAVLLVLRWAKGAPDSRERQLLHNRDTCRGNTQEG